MNWVCMRVTQEYPVFAAHGVLKTKNGGINEPTNGLFASKILITDRVRSTREGYVLTHVCPSVCPDGGGGTPARSDGGISTGQQMEYLIRRSRYASCVHAGGLFCLRCVSKYIIELSITNLGITRTNKAFAFAFTFALFEYTLVSKYSSS